MSPSVSSRSGQLSLDVKPVTKSQNLSFPGLIIPRTAGKGRPRLYSCLNNSISDKITRSIAENRCLHSFLSSLESCLDCLRSWLIWTMPPRPPFLSAFDQTVLILKKKSPIPCWYQWCVLANEPYHRRRYELFLLNSWQLKRILGPPIACILHNSSNLPLIASGRQNIIWTY